MKGSEGTEVPTMLRLGDLYTYRRARQSGRDGTVGGMIVKIRSKCENDIGRNDEYR